LRRIFKGYGSVMLPWFDAGELGGRHEQVRRIWDRLRTISPIRALLGAAVPMYFIAGRRPPAAQPPQR